MGLSTFEIEAQPFKKNLFTIGHLIIIHNDIPQASRCDQFSLPIDLFCLSSLSLSLLVWLGYSLVCHRMSVDRTDINSYLPQCFVSSINSKNLRYH